MPASRAVLFGAGAFALALVIGWRVGHPAGAETVLEPKNLPPEAAPLCPWREPDSDLKAFFPTATRYETETRILSGLRLEVTRRLGRAPLPEENALRLFRIYRDQTPLGAVLVRRVKGQYGAIELVLAADSRQQVRGLRLQRLREPESIARVLEDPESWRTLEGKSVGDPGWPGEDMSEVPEPARASAHAIIEGARSMLILLEVAEESRAATRANSHHH